MKTKIAIASDDVGFARKEEIKKYLIEEKNMEIVYDPVICKEQGVNNFARLADEMAGIIQRDECRLGNLHLWDWHWLYLSDQQTLGHKSRCGY